MTVIDPGRVISVLIGIISTAAFVWVRAVLAHRRDNAKAEQRGVDRAELRARWEGQVSTKLEVLAEASSTMRSALDRILERIDRLPCGACHAPVQRRTNE